MSRIFMVAKEKGKRGTFLVYEGRNGKFFTKSEPRKEYTREQLFFFTHGNNEQKNSQQ